MEGQGMMQMIAEAFRTGGVWMYLVLAIAAITHPAGILSLIGAFLAKPGQRKFVIGLGVLGLLGVVGTILIGWVGYTVGIIEMNEALEKVSPENAEKMRELGTRLSKYPLNFSLLASVFPGIASVLVLIRGLTLRSDQGQPTA